MKLNTQNKWFIAALTTAMSVAVVAPTSAATQFTDVGEQHSYVKEIEEMAKKGVIKGYNDGTFKPKEMITRRQAANLLSRAFEEFSNPNANKGAKITDVTSKNDAYTAIKRVVEAGIMDVNAKGEFRPGDVMTRGEMAKSLAIAYDLAKKGYNKDKHNFVDKSKMKNYEAANMLFQAGVTTGYGDGTFGEKKGVSREHYAVFMFRASELEKATAKPETKPTPKPEPEKPATAEEQAIIELSEKLSKAEPPNGKSRADATAENIQAGKAYTASYPNSSYIGERGTDPIGVSREITNLIKYDGYSREEAIEILDTVTKGELFITITPKGKRMSMYIKFENGYNKLVSQVEK